MKLLTTPEAAARLGVTVTRVQQLIAAGRLPAQKLGRDYFISEGALKLVQDRKPGRPPKPKTESAAGPDRRVVVKPTRATKKGGRA